MKKNVLYIGIGFVLAAAITALLSTHDICTEKQTRPLVLSMTASVEVPESMNFAGETIDFNRYDFHERMDRELNSFTYFHSTTLLLFKRANRIFPIIEPILKQQGVPDDMKYLAVIESSLDPRAVSPARAAGLWQFLASTGKSYGLEVSSEVDERYHVEKSTVAACQYLKEAYRQFGSWRAAALSYNGGKGRISKELREQQTNNALELWLVNETTRYYYRMLAIKSIFENPKKYGFILKANQLYKPIAFKRMTVSGSISDLASFARQQGITYAQLKDFNSWLRDRKLTNKSGKTYTLLIPTKESLYYNKYEQASVHDKRWIEE